MAPSQFHPPFPRVSHGLSLGYHLWQFVFSCLQHQTWPLIMLLCLEMNSSYSAADSIELVK